MGNAGFGQPQNQTTRNWVAQTSGREQSPRQTTPMYLSVRPRKPKVPLKNMPPYTGLPGKTVRGQFEQTLATDLPGKTVREQFEQTLANGLPGKTVRGQFEQTLANGLPGKTVREQVEQAMVPYANMPPYVAPPGKTVRGQFEQTLANGLPGKTVREQMEEIVRGARTGKTIRGQMMRTLTGSRAGRATMPYARILPYRYSTRR